MSGEHSSDMIMSRVQRLEADYAEIGHSLRDLREEGREHGELLIEINTVLKGVVSRVKPLEGLPAKVAELSTLPEKVAMLAGKAEERTIWKLRISEWVIVILALSLAIVMGYGYVAREARGIVTGAPPVVSHPPPAGVPPP